MQKKIEQLKQLYDRGSKHSNYQILPLQLAKLLGGEIEQTQSRYENERLKYITDRIDFKGRSVLDIGGNTGFFVFELLAKGASNFHHYEGDINHSRFVKLASEVLGVEEQIRTTNDYYSFDKSERQEYDIVLLLNVLHHLGDDYGNSSWNLKKVKENIILQLNSLAEKSKLLVFQMGYCWKGNPSEALFENGTKSEMIEFLRMGIRDHWDIVNVGIPCLVENKIEYCTIDSENVQRRDELGEFLNRPLIILQSKVNQMED